VIETVYLVLLVAAFLLTGWLSMYAVYRLFQDRH